MLSDYETNFPHKLLLTNRQVANFGKVFPNNLSSEIKLSKTKISTMTQSRGFLCRLLGSLLKIGKMFLMKNVIKLWAKIVLILLALTASASAADAGIHKRS